MPLSTSHYIAELPRDRLTLPEPYLYKLLLDAQKLEDTAERRREFKRLLVTRQMEEGIAPPQVDQKELTDFMNPDDPELKMDRSLALARLLERHLEEIQDFLESQRPAVLELFHRESPLRQGEMDRAYFENPELVRADLEAFATQFGIDKTPLDLHTGNIQDLHIICQNGQKVRGRFYLETACKALGTAKNKTEASSKVAAILKQLLKTVGFDIFDKDYFQDQAKVKADLTVFASQLGEGKIPFDLSTLNIGPLSITCQNGRVIKGQSYLRIAAIALGFGKNTVEAMRVRGYTLKYLLKTAGFDLFDEDYFRDPNKVKADLTAFAIQLGAHKTLLELNAKKLRSLSIVCTNGQTMRGGTYLSAAARALGFAKDSKEAKTAHSQVFKHLLKIVGFDIPEYAPLDKAYFEDPDKVKADLTAFAAELGEDKTPLDLSTSNIKPLSINCQNGQVMKGQAYLHIAAKTFGFVRTTKEASSKLFQTFRKLKQIAGFEVNVTELTEYPPLDETYFKEAANVRTDLEALALAASEKAGKTIQPKGLNTGHLETFFTLTTGESMIGQTYLRCAAMALGKAKNKKEVSTMYKSILISLKKIAGFEVTEYPLLDEFYSRDSAKVRTDLDSLAEAVSKKTGKTIQSNNLNTTHVETSFVLTTGESITGSTYLNRVAKALGKAKDHKEAQGIQKATLALLKKTAGFTPE